MSAADARKDQDKAPFDDVRELAMSVPERAKQPGTDLIERANVLGRDLRPMGTLTHPLARIATVQGTSAPNLTRPLVAVFSGSHSVAEADNVTLVTKAKARVEGLSSKAAAVRGIAQEAGAAFKIYEFGLDYPAADFRKGPSLSERDCAAAIAFGMEVVAEGADIIVLGSAGFGSATASAAIARGLYGGAADYWAGGSDANAQARIEAVQKGGTANATLHSDPLHVLRAYGGRDIAGLVGAILACAHQRIPVILDGYVVTAAAAVIHSINPEAVAHCIAGHVTIEPAHRALLDRLDMRPVLDLGINIGDGTGGSFALNLLQSANSGLGTLD